MSSLPPKPDRDAPDPAPPGGPRFLPNPLIASLVLLAVLGVAVFLSMPSRSAREDPVRRAQCINNLKQIGLALDNYVEAHGVLPPASTVDPNGRALHSWRTLILPYMEQGPLYAMIDLTKPWDDPANARARAIAISVYHCPSSDDPATTTTYLASAGADACFADHAGRPLAEITDGRGSTLMLVEAGPADAIPWMQPSDADAALIDRLAAAKSHHPGGFNTLRGDGVVSSFTPKVQPQVLRAMRTIAGGEPPPPDRF